jgi:hypothetical protein
MKTLIPAVGLVSCFALAVAGRATGATAPAPSNVHVLPGAAVCRTKPSPGALETSARKALQRVYVAEKAYMQEKDVYSSNWQAIGFSNPDACLAVSLTLEGSPITGTWFATARSVDTTGPTWCITPKGVIGVATAHGLNPAPPITSVAACEALSAKPAPPTTCNKEPTWAALATRARSTLGRILTAEKNYFQEKDVYSSNWQTIGFSNPDACLTVTLTVPSVGPVNPDWFATARRHDKFGPVWCITPKTGIVRVATAHGLDPAPPITSSKICEALPVG